MNCGLMNCVSILRFQANLGEFGAKVEVKVKVYVNLGERYFKIFFGSKSAYPPSHCNFSHGLPQSLCHCVTG
jgi:hypothetical protein